jgi:hypothetical protein
LTLAQQTRLRHQKSIAAAVRRIATNPMFTPRWQTENAKIFSFRSHDGTARPQHAHGESEGCQETQQTLANFGGFLGLFLGNKVIKTMIFGEEILNPAFL